MVTTEADVAKAYAGLTRTSSGRYISSGGSSGGSRSSSSSLPIRVVAGKRVTEKQYQAFISQRTQEAEQQKQQSEQQTQQVEQQKQADVQQAQQIEQQVRQQAPQVIEGRSVYYSPTPGWTPQDPNAVVVYIDNGKTTGQVSYKGQDVKITGGIDVRRTAGHKAISTGIASAERDAVRQQSEARLKEVTLETQSKRKSEDKSVKHISPIPVMGGGENESPIQVQQPQQLPTGQQTGFKERILQSYKDIDEKYFLGVLPGGKTSKEVSTEVTKKLIKSDAFKYLAEKQKEGKDVVGIAKDVYSEEIATYGGLLPSRKGIYPDGEITVKAGFKEIKTSLEEERAKESIKEVFTPLAKTAVGAGLAGTALIATSPTWFPPLAKFKIGSVGVGKHLIYQAGALSLKELGVGEYLQETGTSLLEEAQSQPEGLSAFGKATVGATLQIASFPIEHSLITSGMVITETLFPKTGKVVKWGLRGVGLYKGIVEPTFGIEGGITVPEYIPGVGGTTVFEKNTYSAGLGEAVPYVALAELPGAYKKYVEGRTLTYPKGKGLWGAIKGAKFTKGDGFTFKDTPTGGPKQKTTGGAKQKPSGKPSKTSTLRTQSIDRAEVLRPKLKTASGTERTKIIRELVAIDRGVWTPDYSSSTAPSKSIWKDKSGLWRPPKPTGGLVKTKPSYDITKFTQEPSRIFPFIIPETGMTIYESPGGELDVPLTSPPSKKLPSPPSDKSLPVPKEDFPVEPFVPIDPVLDFTPIPELPDGSGGGDRLPPPPKPPDPLPPPPKPPDPLPPPDVSPPRGTGEITFPEIPGLGVPLFAPPWIGVGGGQSGVPTFGQGKQRKKRRLGYTPSFRAVLQNIRTPTKPLPTYPGLWTGQELRPIIQPDYVPKQRKTKSKNLFKFNFKTPTFKTPNFSFKTTLVKNGIKKKKKKKKGSKNSFKFFNNKGSKGFPAM